MLGGRQEAPGDICELTQTQLVNKSTTCIRMVLGLEFWAHLRGASNPRAKLQNFATHLQFLLWVLWIVSIWFYIKPSPCAWTKKKNPFHFLFNYVLWLWNIITSPFKKKKEMWCFLSWSVAKVLINLHVWNERLQYCASTLTTSGFPMGFMDRMQEESKETLNSLNVLWVGPISRRSTNSFSRPPFSLYTSVMKEACILLSHPDLCFIEDRETRRQFVTTHATASNIKLHYKVNVCFDQKPSRTNATEKLIYQLNSKHGVCGRVAKQPFLCLVLSALFFIEDLGPASVGFSYLLVPRLPHCNT